MKNTNLPTNSEGRIIGGRKALDRERAMRMQRERDMKRAENLRKSRAIANVKPGTGPRIAR